MRAAEMAHCDTVVLIFSGILFVMTSFQLGSSFFVFNYVLFPLFKDPLIWVLARLRIIGNSEFGWFGSSNRVHSGSGILESFITSEVFW